MSGSKFNSGEVFPNRKFSERNRFNQVDAEDPDSHGLSGAEEPAKTPDKLAHVEDGGVADRRKRSSLRRFFDLGKLVLNAPPKPPEVGGVNPDVISRRGFLKVAAGTAAGTAAVLGLEEFAARARLLGPIAKIFEAPATSESELGELTPLENEIQFYREHLMVAPERETQRALRLAKQILSGEMELAPTEDSLSITFSFDVSADLGNKNFFTESRYITITSDKNTGTSLTVDVFAYELLKSVQPDLAQTLKKTDSDLPDILNPKYATLQLDDMSSETWGKVEALINLLSSGEPIHGENDYGNAKSLASGVDYEIDNVPFEVLADSAHSDDAHVEQLLRRAPQGPIRKVAWHLNELTRFNFTEDAGIPVSTLQVKTFLTLNVDNGGPYNKDEDVDANVSQPTSGPIISVEAQQVRPATAYDSYGIVNFQLRNGVDGDALKVFVDELSQAEVNFWTLSDRLSPSPIQQFALRLGERIKRQPQH
jgi:hypothetical protein